MNTSIDLRQARILIANADTVSRQALEELLRDEGYSAIETTPAYHDLSTRFPLNQMDLALLDLGALPRHAGLQAIAQFRRWQRDDLLPVMAMAHWQDRQSRLMALHCGAKDFIATPFDPLEIAIRIRNLLETRLLHRHVQMQNRILEDSVKARTRELEETRLEIIQRLGLAAEYRDNETGLHIVRMSEYCRVLAQASGFTPAAADLLRHASPMHDIGKIGIPDRILMKPGKLSREERTLIQTHTTIGARILSGHHSDLMESARVIALQHHEKWDGGGYPHGLKQEEIFPLARITAICDVFDALTSARPYKAPWRVEHAVAEIDRQSGAHFDPALVVNFHRALPEILQIKAHYAEPDDAFSVRPQPSFPHLFQEQTHAFAS
ncbi:MAG TPA: two-component system response regulator [Betaproteobacteria bacterium]|nr:two-component system response regulator [Betaproteobacteria bacterium]